MRSFKLDEFVAHGSSVNCLRIGRNTAGVLATGGDDKKVNLWRIGQPHVAKSLSGLQSPVECVTFDSTENFVAAGGANGTVKVWDLESSKVDRSLTGHRSNCLTVEFYPFEPKLLVTGSLDTNVKVWDLRRKDCINTFKGHTKGIKKLAISPDGKWVCSGSENGEIKLWDMQTGRVVKDGWSHDNSITGIEFHPSEFILATSGMDRVVRIWDLETWELMDTLGPEATAIKAIAYHKDGKQLLTATSDALKVWGCEPAVHYDTVPMDWRHLVDMHLSYKDDQPRVGFVNRGNLEGAFKSILSHNDAAIASMLVEALQRRQDAFELNSLEPLLKLLELLLASGVEQQQGVGLSALSLVLRGPGQLVKDVCSAPTPAGVDLSYENRKNKCLLVKMALEGLGMKVGVLARGAGVLAARAQLVAEELKQVVD
eukprot:gene7929-8125_t